MAETPAWARRKRMELVHAVYQEMPHLTVCEAAEIALERLILETMQEPGDPLLTLARQVVADAHEDQGTKQAILAGEWDAGTRMDIALRALKRGIELGLSQ